ncbi:hypothetical protein CA13_67790 [Planctomycetes bacterium CA13]|uniref:Secreted protein n=1 Tax=Novipirellula herctigrandis TaxID=2527986 RepID=A0A5C5YN28_9BACT|nr:hypothetical protein CA13_67790 [Planctomycetes bacterium CA13]
MGSQICTRVLAFLTVTLAIAFGFSKPVTADDGSLATEPFVVFVAQEEAYTRCGPSDEYYRTDPLRYGQELEVYVETADGWLGVRPPENSFCWVPADAIELASDSETGVVIEDRTVAWIGTHLGRARQYRWQVQLAKGEPLTIIGRSEREGPDGPRLWYRVVPPSGEFRWVHTEQVAASAEALVAAVRRAEESENGDIEFLPGGSNHRDDSIANAAIANAAIATVPTPPRDVDARSEDSRRADDRIASDDFSNESSRSSSRRTERNRNLSPVSYEDTPMLRDAPGLSHAEHGTGVEPIGSGLNQQWQSNPTSEGVGPSLSSAEFIGRPRFQDIDAGVRQIGKGLLEPTAAGRSTAPSGIAQAGDENWVIGSLHGRSNGTVAQVSNQQPITLPISQPAIQPRQPNVNNQPLATRYVDANLVTQVESEVRGADIEKLSLMLSRMMAQSASAAEVWPLSQAAQTLAASTPDQVVGGRARLLAERAEQYRRVAERRDGNTVVRGRTAPAIPVAPVSGVAPVSLGVPSIAPSSETGVPAAPNQLTQSGFLVQVYSARKDSPPFALTDNGGRTIAYVTPTPGVNLRMHLNSEIQVQGVQTYLRGLNTPHIIASHALRASQ